jgi:hypothetical protein
MATRIQAPASHSRQAQTQNAQPTIKTAPPTEKDQPPDDDLVPSLPPDWQPPTFLTQDMPTSDSEASEDEEVKDAIIM